MDLTSTVRPDTLSSVGSVLIPGSLAAGPYVALVWGPPHNLKMLVNANEGLSTVIAALLVVAMGLLVESLGSYAEYYVIDRLHADPKALTDRFAEYLQVSWKVEPIGQHYLRRVLIIFKFELNLLVATVATLPGTLALASFGILSQHALVGFLGVTLVLGAYLLRAAYDSSKLLDQVRTQLIAHSRQERSTSP
jgi:hypothetical protein